MILSWDIGIYNLSYCLLKKDVLDTDLIDSNIVDSSDNKLIKSNIKNFDNYEIVDWGIINISDKINIKKNKKKVYENIPDILDKYVDFMKAEYILIENQPCMKNPTMKSIQMILYSYFLIKGLKNNDSNIHTIELYHQ